MKLNYEVPPQDLEIIIEFSSSMLDKLKKAKGDMKIDVSDFLSDSSFTVLEGITTLSRSLKVLKRYYKAQDYEGCEETENRLGMETRYHEEIVRRRKFLEEE